MYTRKNLFFYFRKRSIYKIYSIYIKLNYGKKNIHQNILDPARTSGELSFKFQGGVCII